MNETMEKLGCFFEDKERRERLLHRNSGDFFAVWQLVTKDIALMEKDEDPIGDVRKVIHVLRKMRHWVSFDRATADQLGLFKDFSLLIFNWNHSGIRSNEVKNECHSIRDIVDGNLTMRDTINIMKEVSAHFSKLREWNPPAFEISKSLLERLK